MTYRLYGRAGWGSAIVEAQLAWYGLPYAFEPVGDLFKEPDARARLEKVNPLAQVPTLVLPDGTVMSESAAITLLLADITGRDSLVPGPQSAERASFLRWYGDLASASKIARSPRMTLPRTCRWSFLVSNPAVLKRSL